MLNTFKIQFKGQVQGVGFRPYVSKLAHKYGLRGNVSNNEDGVVINVSGDPNVIGEFYQTLVKTPPPLSRIKSYSIREVAASAFNLFEIVPTEAKGKLNLALTPDFGICQSCSEEINDPDNRRFHYPFTTCVNCGPRWSITKTFPFERNHTTMEEFSMCPECEKEYIDQDNRRFHSQTNSCPSCGIQLELQDNNGMTVHIPSKKIIGKVAEFIRNGKILAIKNTGGYLLCCDAGNTETIKKLRRLKKRPKKPFAILYPTLELLKRQLPIDEFQARELSSTERPIVIVSSKRFKGRLALDELAPGLRQLGVMLPNSGLLELLCKELGKPVLATSGNIHGSPVISNKAKSMELISQVADYFLHHNLEISNAQDDSVVKFSFKHSQRILFRRSRGFAPNYFQYEPSGENKVLALGGHLKSTIAFTPNDYLYLSQYLGNLDHFEVYKRFEETAALFMGIFEEKPDVILVDDHPDYLSTRFGEELSLTTEIPVYGIQHHKAHFASVLGEHHLFGSEDKVLGVIWDGTGYGDDAIFGEESFSPISMERSREQVISITITGWPEIRWQKSQDSHYFLYTMTRGQM